MRMIGWVSERVGVWVSGGFFMPIYLYTVFVEEIVGKMLKGIGKEKRKQNES